MRAPYSFLFLFLPMAGLVPAAASAQEAQVQDIVVTAQGREQRLKDVPISAAVVSGATLQRSGIRNLEELVATLPGVKIATAPGADLLRIRGVGSGNNLGFEQSVATFVDGIYRGRARASRATLFDLERVELLRGPQTTFFGNNAIGGALNITTRKPAQEFAANASVLYSAATDEYNVEGGITIPVTETLAARFAGRLSGMDGYIRNELIDRNGPHLRDAGGRASFKWTPNPKVTIEARFDATRLRDDGTWYSELLHCPPKPEYGPARGACARAIAANGNAPIDDRLDLRTSTGDGYYNHDMTETEVSTTVDLNGPSLLLRTGYFDHDYKNLLAVVPVANGSVVNTVSAGNTFIGEDYRSLSQEARLESDTGGTLEWMVGGYFSSSRLKISNGTGFFWAPLGALAPGFTATTPIAAWMRFREKRRTLSAFASATVRVADPLRINLGLRYTSVRAEAHRAVEVGSTAENLDYGSFVPATSAAQAILLPLTGTPTGDYPDPKRTDDKLLPSIAVQYDVGQSSMAYASYSKGFKAGGFAVQTSKTSFDPETVDAFEMGLKTSLLDRAVDLNAALFWSRYQDLQESVTVLNETGSGVAMVANVGKSTQKGVEATLIVRPVAGLQLSIDASYLSSRYNSFRDGACTVLQSLVPGCVQDLKGARGAFAPKWSGSIGFAYIRPLTDSLQLRVESALFHSSRFFQTGNADPLLVQKSYEKLDGRIALVAPTGRWEAAIIGKNLTDVRTASFRQVVPSATGSIQALPDRPRSIAFQLSIRY